MTESKMTIDERMTKLRSVTIRAKMRSIKGLRELIEHFDSVAHECDSSAHEVAAISMRWAADRIYKLESRLLDIQTQTHIVRS